jgi:hypothetical protein
MMIKRVLQAIVLLTMTAILVGCGGDATTITPTASVSDGETGNNRPSAPAGDDYRPDPASWVGNSGTPQLVEVFSYD